MKIFNKSKVKLPIDKHQVTLVYEVQYVAIDNNHEPVRGVFNFVTTGEYRIGLDWAQNKIKEEVKLQTVKILNFKLKNIYYKNKGVISA